MKVIARHQVAYSNVLHTAHSGVFEMKDEDYPQYINDVDKFIEVKEVVPEVTKEVKKAPRNKKLNLKIRRTK